VTTEPGMSGNRPDRTSGTSDGGNERPMHRVRRYSRPMKFVLITSLVALVGIAWVGIARSKEEAVLNHIASAQIPMDSAPATSSSVFTPSHTSLYDAFKEYIGWQSTPVQPIAFNHKIHLQNGLQCTSCHVGVTQGPDAGIPSVSFCMACHQVIAVQNPEIKKLTAYAEKGQEVPWQPVYWFYPDRHVRFRHSPHIRAGVDCRECHGDLSQQTVAVRSKDLTMNLCLNCHWAKGASVDCTTCHY
jgi:Cytochrome c7 and related cytochrome c